MNRAKTKEELLFQEQQKRERWARIHRQEQFDRVMTEASNEVVLLDGWREELAERLRPRRISLRVGFAAPLVLVAGILLCIPEVTQPLGVVLSVCAIIAFIGAVIGLAVSPNAEDFDVRRLENNIHVSQNRYDNLMAESEKYIDGGLG